MQIDIRELRHEIGLSQSELGSLLGVSVRLVSCWEAARGAPSGLPLQLLLAMVEARSQKRLGLLHAAVRERFYEHRLTQIFNAAYGVVPRPKLIAPSWSQHFVGPSDLIDRIAKGEDT
jgi:DNA-binding XRE family transcriptional regulator